jgi:hypothetical protein
MVRIWRIDQRTDAGSANIAIPEQNSTISLAFIIRVPFRGGVLIIRHVNRAKN